MASKASEGMASKPSARKAAAKKPKTGGRAKKSTAQLLDEANARDAVAKLGDDTLVAEELAALYLGTTQKTLADTRRAYQIKTKDGQGKSVMNIVALPDMWKLMKPGAVGQNQDVLYKMKDLRDYVDAIKAPTSHQVAVNSGIFGFMTTHMPFFAEPTQGKRNARQILVASAWNRDDPKREERFKDAAEKKLAIVWLTPMEAATSRWIDVDGHKEFAHAATKLLAEARGAVDAALDATEILAETNVSQGVRSGGAEARAPQ